MQRLLRENLKDQPRCGGAWQWRKRPNRCRRPITVRLVQGCQHQEREPMLAPAPLRIDHWLEYILVMARSGLGMQRRFRASSMPENAMISRHDLSTMQIRSASVRIFDFCINPLIASSDRSGSGAGCLRPLQCRGSSQPRDPVIAERDF